MNAKDASPDANQPSAASSEAPGRILLVDDQPELRRLFQRTLTKAGHEVVAATSAQSALVLAENQHFDVVISDVHMPDMTGIELLAKLHAADPDLSVLLVSGSPDLATALKAVELGALEYLPKPVTFEKLRESASRAVTVRRARADAKHALAQLRSGERVRSPAGDRPDAWSGELLAGRYRVGRLLGAGGMGSVYEATREDLGQMRVALKLLHASLASESSLLARFRREAETVGQVNHPNIVRILDFHADPPDPPFLVMELLDGVSVKQELLRHGPFAPQRAVFIASQVLAALAAVHRAQVIHRDIKPENVLLTAISGLGDIVKLLDFGVAKVQAVPGQTLTQVGTVVGTLAYMSPEHARGAAIDTRSDLYAVAALLYEMLSATPPFTGESFNAVLYAIQRGVPMPLAQLRPELEPALLQLVERGMSLEPSERFQTAEEMTAALAPWLNLDAGSTPPQSSAAVFAPTIPPPASER